MGLQFRGLAADPFAEHFTHPPDERPYRMVVFGGFSGHNAPLYWVAGEGDKLLGARKAVSCATEKHGERCFYCDGKGELTIEHILPSAFGGTDACENWSSAASVATKIRVLGRWPASNRPPPRVGRLRGKRTTSASSTGSS